MLEGPDGGDPLTGVESVRSGDGRVLELNRMYGPGAGVAESRALDIQKRADRSARRYRRA